MRSPRDTQAAPPPLPDGGKALLRLDLFLQSRGLGPVTAIRDAPAVPVDEYGAAATALGAPAPVGGGGAGGNAALRGPRWRFLGPSQINNGQTYGGSRVVVSGRVSAIAVDPSDTDHVLVGAAAGGVWQSHDAGASWSPRTDRMPTLTIGAIAFDSSTPRTVFAGTGEGNWYRWLGQGVLRSRDGGRRWSVLASAPFLGQGFFALLVDPAAGTHLLAATTRGVYESSDGGVTWAQRHGRGAWDLSINPTGGPGAEVLAAAFDGLQRSIDGGTTWAPVALPGAPAFWDRLAAQIAPSNPAIAYAFGASGGAAYLWRSDGTGTWSAVTLPPFGTNQAWYDWFVAPAPDSESQVYIGAIDAFRGDLAGGSWNWTDITTKPAGSDSIHPDQHAIAFDPSNPNTIYVGNDGGLFRSDNRGDNWKSLNEGLGITEVEYIAENPSTRHWVLAGTQDNGTIEYTGSPAWDHVADGDGGDCGVNAATPNTCFHSYYYMGLERSTAGGAWGSWNWIGPNPVQPYSTLFYPPMGADSSTIAQAGQSVFVSRDDGTSWSEVLLPAGLVTSALVVPDSDHLFAGTTSGRIFRTDWTGAGWSPATELTSPWAPSAAWVSCIFVSASNLNRIWVTSTTVGGGRVFRSDDGGATWHDRSPGLPGLPINSVVVDPHRANRVWVGADVGVWESRNSGGAWHPFSNGLPNVLVEDLKFHTHSRRLRAGTRNRGVWEVRIPQH